MCRDEILLFPLHRTREDWISSCIQTPRARERARLYYFPDICRIVKIAWLRAALSAAPARNLFIGSVDPLDFFP